MKTIRAACWRFLGLLRKTRRDAEMAEEIQEHVEASTERKVAAGMSPGEARQAALREFGGVEQWKRACARRTRLALAGPAPARSALRVADAATQPRFSALAILCLTLGIGTNAAVFSWIEGILFHPYPAVVHEGRMFTLAVMMRGAFQGSINFRIRTVLICKRTAR